MNQYIVQAVKQMIEYLNSTLGTEDEFLAFKIEITREINAFGQETYRIAAYDVKDKPFMYAWYVDGDNIIADGY